jgi:hypothetical protein
MIYGLIEDTGRPVIRDDCTTSKGVPWTKESYGPAGKFGTGRGEHP